MAWLVLGIAVAVVPVIAFTAQRYRDRAELRTDSTAGNLLVQPIADWGMVDGTHRQRERSKRAFATLEQKVGCSREETHDLYQKALEVEGMFIPLAAVYAFAVGEYVENPQVELPTERPKTAKKTINSVKAFFPVLYRHIKQNHSAHDAELIVLISMNLLDYFFDHEKMLKALEG